MGRTSVEGNKDSEFLYSKSLGLQAKKQIKVQSNIGYRGQCQQRQIYSRQLFHSDQLFDQA